MQSEQQLIDDVLDLHLLEVVFIDGFVQVGGDVVEDEVDVLA